MANLPQSAPPPVAGEGDQPEAETRMRRALGLMPGGRSLPARSRSETVAVEHRGGRGHAQGVNRVAVAETALVEERKRREQAERERDEARAAQHEAQTKRGHAEMMRDEAIAARDAALLARDEAVAALEAERLSLQVAAPRRRTEWAEPAEPVELMPRRRGRPPKAPVPMAGGDDEPVQWWTPGWSE